MDGPMLACSPSLLVSHMRSHSWPFLYLNVSLCVWQIESFFIQWPFSSNCSHGGKGGTHFTHFGEEE